MRNVRIAPGGRGLVIDNVAVTSTAAEIDANAGVTPGVAAALKTLVLDAAKAIATITTATITNLTSSVISLGTGHIDGNLRISVGADVAAAGTVLADAAQLLEGFQVVTGADGTKGVKLPATPVAGTLCIIKGTTSAVLKVWPDAAATINAIGSNGAMSLASGVIPAIFIAKSPTQWYTLPLLPS
jgi:hypothetical protein